MGAPDGEMREILDTIREVRGNLERRADRAYGAVLMIWGLAAASVFLFYQLVWWNHAPYDAAFGPLLPWAWMGPMLVGYVATAVVGARLGRVAATRPAARRVVEMAMPTVLGVAGTVFLILREDYARIPGLWILFLGAITFWQLWVRREHGVRAVRAGGFALAAVSVPVGAWLLLLPTAYANLVAAVLYGLGLVALGTLRYRAG